MNNILGCGKVMYGNLSKRSDESYIKTEWFCIFYFPIIPLASYRLIKKDDLISQSGYVISSSTTYTIVEYLNLNIAQVLFSYFSILIPVFYATLILVGINNESITKSTIFNILNIIAIISSPIFLILYSKKTNRKSIGWAVFALLFPILPFIFAFFVPSKIGDQ